MTERGFGFDFWKKSPFQKSKGKHLFNAYCLFQIPIIERQNNPRELQKCELRVGCGLKSECCLLKPTAGNENVLG